MKLSHNQMVRFWYKAGVFVLVLIACDIVLGMGMRYLYFRQGSGPLYRTTYAMEKTSQELLIFGSSRASHHYQPEIIQAATGMTTYNTGKDGNFILYNTAVLKSTLKRYTPKVIVLDIDVFTFNRSQENYDRLSALLPYYRSHPEIRDIVSLRGPFEKVKTLSFLYPYNSMILKILMGNQQYKQDINGYAGLTTVETKPASSFSVKEATDTVLVNAFASFLTAAKAAGSQVYVIASPVHYTYDHSETLEQAKKLCKEYGVTFWDYSTDKNFLANAALFADRAHLNDAGARHFSQLIAGRLKP